MSNKFSTRITGDCTDVLVGGITAFSKLLPHVEQFAKDHPVYADPNSSPAEQAVAMGIFYGCPGWFNQTMCMVVNKDPYSHIKLGCARDLPAFIHLDRYEDNLLSFVNNGMSDLGTRRYHPYLKVTAEEILADLSFVVLNPGLNVYLLGQ